jgi:hypothetical protein
MMSLLTQRPLQNNDVVLMYVIKTKGIYVSVKKLLRIVGFALIIAVVVIGQRWYSYVTNTTDPFNEVGIQLQSYMPAPIRHWGCMKLKENFGNKTLPPYGCSAGDGRSWVE